MFFLYWAEKISPYNKICISDESETVTIFPYPFLGSCVVSPKIIGSKTIQPQTIGQQYF
jgi:hypothetical protein